MNKLFYEFEAFKPARLVWGDKASTGPQAAPQTAEANPEAKATPPAADKPAGPNPAESAQKAAEVKAAGDKEKAATAKDAEELLKQFLGPSFSIQARMSEKAPTQEKIKDVIGKYGERMKGFLIRAADLYKEEKTENLDVTIEGYLKTGLELQETIPKEDFEVINWILWHEVTPEELQGFEAKYVKDGKINFDFSNLNDLDLSKARDIMIFATYVKTHADQMPKIDPTRAQQMVTRGREIAKRLSPIGEKLAQKAKFVEIDAVYRAHATEYQKYLDAKAEDKLAAKKVFLDSIKDPDKRKIMEEAMDKLPTSQEQAYVSKYTEFLKDGHKTPDELMKALADGKIGYRESRVALSLITEDDITKFNATSDRKITTEQATQIRDLRKRMETAQKAGKSSLNEDLKGVGIVALIQKLIEQLTKLIDQLGVQLNKAFGIDKGVKPCETSPIDGGGHFTISKYEKGKGVILTPTETSKKVTSIVNGKVESVDDSTGTVTISFGDKGKIIYGGLTDIQVKNGDAVNEAAIGKIATPLGTIKDDTLTLQIKSGDKDEDLDPTELLSKFSVASKPATPAAAPANAPATDAKPAGEPAKPAAEPAKPAAAEAPKPDPAAPAPAPGDKKQ